MIKLLLADDEDYIRQGIRYTIPWEAHGMEIVAEASNGADALSLAVKIKPDIILADIQMPLMSGLELAKQLRTLLPGTKLIILTAHGNTDNLTQAIQVKVDAFILKSADSDQILQTVIKVKEELELELHAQKKTEHLRGIYDENRHLIKATLMTRFLQNQVSYSHFIEKAKHLDMTTETDGFAMILIKCSCMDEKRTTGQLFQYFQEYKPFVFFLKDQLAVIILNTDRGEFGAPEMEELLPSLRPLAFGNSIILMNQIESYEEFPIVFAQLTKALDHCFWNQEKIYSILSSYDVFATETLSVSYLQESELISAILNKNITSIQDKLTEYYQMMSLSCIPRLMFLESVKRLLILIHAIAEQHFDLEQTLTTLFDLETPLEILELLKSLALPGITQATHSQISLALKYIDEHFTEDLHLDDVAKVSYLSVGYLSRIFRTETGYSFKEYLHTIRIKNAHRLLSTTTLKYYEIAEKVGYKNYKYFSSYFNKITGCSAKEYQLLHTR